MALFACRDLTREGWDPFEHRVGSSQVSFLFFAFLYSPFPRLPCHFEEVLTEIVDILASKPESCREASRVRMKRRSLLRFRIRTRCGPLGESDSQYKFTMWNPRLSCSKRCPRHQNVSARVIRRAWHCRRLGLLVQSRLVQASYVELGEGSVFDIDSESLLHTAIYWYRAIREFGASARQASFGLFWRLEPKFIGWPNLGNCLSTKIPVPLVTSNQRQIAYNAWAWSKKEKVEAAKCNARTI